ncbi:hypothetical protein [Burkholderia pseudomallei]|uniref:hypothetical protein n=1 Tax=Burkholderia pseudomallei TaxID=28450 RepID=UPI000F15971D|nr:hypothetical protein [Burkholderia pseudomallei]VBD34734.1 Uncharacterised protein [Burkholderia pseudomallei]
MSDLDATQGADGATNAGVGATADAALASTEPTSPTDAGAAPVGEFGSAAPAPAAADAGWTQSAATALTDGTTGAAAGADGAPALNELLSTDAVPAGEQIASGEVTLLADTATVVAVPLLPRVEQLGRRAFDAGQTDEHNLMAWLHQHIDALKRAIAGAPNLPLSDDAKALVDELKGLL